MCNLISCYVDILSDLRGSLPSFLINSVLAGVRHISVLSISV